MRVLVVHASVHGSTAEIGDRVAESAAKAGPDVDVRAVARGEALEAEVAGAVGELHDPRGA